jgi:hypothetical protein
MPLSQPTIDFMKYLKDNPAIRARIMAAPGKTLLYAGSFFGPMWKQIAREKLSNPQLAEKQTLPDVLATISPQGTGHPTLLAYAESVVSQVPWKPDGFVVWRAMSGIFASNASGAVSFQVGSGVNFDKVFVATEVSVLLRNPKIDELTRDILAYYDRCIQNKQWDMNFGFIAA